MTELKIADLYQNKMKILLNIFKLQGLLKRYRRHEEGYKQCFNIPFFWFWLENEMSSIETLTMNIWRSILLIRASEFIFQ